MSEKYDSKGDTLQHIREVYRNISFFIKDLLNRGNHHDDSKLDPEEKELFDEYTPKLKNLKYPSPEYDAALDELRASLSHHYANNRHHPEHFENGISDMNLIDLVEMLCDWMASAKRHQDGNILLSLAHNKKRFNMSDDLYRVLLNTVHYMDQRVSK